MTRYSALFLVAVFSLAGYASAQEPRQPEYFAINAREGQQGYVAKSNSQDCPPGYEKQTTNRYNGNGSGNMGTSNYGNRSGNFGVGPNGSYGLPQGRRYYNGRYFGNFNNRYYGPQYGYF